MFFSTKKKKRKPTLEMTTTSEEEDLMLLPIVVAHMLCDPSKTLKHLRAPMGPPRRGKDTAHNFSLDQVLMHPMEHLLAEAAVDVTDMLMALVPNGRVMQRNVLGPIRSRLLSAVHLKDRCATSSLVLLYCWCHTWFAETTPQASHGANLELLRDIVALACLAPAEEAEAVSFSALVLSAFVCRHHETPSPSPSPSPSPFTLAHINLQRKLAWLLSVPTQELYTSCPWLRDWCVASAI